MKAILYTAANGSPGVCWPAYGAMLTDESEADFLARIVAKDVPADATGVQVVDTASLPPTAPPAPLQPTPREWLERLPGDKQAAISAAAVQNPAILLWLLKAAGTTTIDVSLDETKQGVGALALAGVLTSDDAAILLAP